MALQFEQVTYTYRSGNQERRTGLDALDLVLEEGRFIAVLGASGSGKSTLLQHFNGLLLPSAGKIRILDFLLEPGLSGKGMKELRRRVGLVFQFPEQQLFAETVEQDLMYGPLNFGMKEPEAREAARSAARALGLDDELLGRNPFHLSGGQMRKTAIATVLAADPDVLVLDEPAATLDQASREELLSLLADLCQSRGKTVILVTHRLEEVLPFAEDYVLLDQGKAIFHGPPEELLADSGLMEQAGIVTPPAVRFLRDFSERFQVPFPEGPYPADHLARFIEQTVREKA
ncbi:ATP-binding cassette domain-containing protein [Gorillibacterium timonense]|uniref:ATP-binding cassette domain-containing protein n=1 Tax=Gorillibacterium timonense TaxID=1689269 RepID=UPI00071D6BE7|nr:ATP-binding cassette domain-containing protein [Gorillibacterium timonense]